MNRVVLCVGSNVAGRYAMVEKTLLWLDRLLYSLKTSSVYETPDWRGRDVMYCNAVAVGMTDKDLAALNDIFKRFEEESGRNDLAREAGIVPVDVDIVMFNEEVLRPREIDREYFTIGYAMIEDK